MAIKTIIQTRLGSFVGDLIDTTTEIISIAVTKPAVGGLSAETIEIPITTGYTMSNSWFLNEAQDLRHILSSLDDQVNTIERTYLDDDIWLSREGVLFIQQTDTGPSLDWGPII